MENTSDREAAIRKQGQAQAQDNAPKPAPQIIGHDRPASSGSTDMFPDVPGVRFDKDGNPIDELPVHRRPR